MKKKMHFTIMGLVVAVLALALALTGCAKTRMRALAKAWT